MSIETAETPSPDVGPRQRHIKKRPHWLAWSLGVVILLIVLLAAYYEVESHAIFSPSSGTAIVTVRSGESASGVYGAMAAEGIIGSVPMMRLYSAIHGSPTILQGSYQMHRGLTFAAAAQDLRAGPNIIPIEVPPGFTVKEIVNRIAAYGANTVADQMMTSMKSGAVRSPFEPASTNNLEGLIAPGQYLITPASTGSQVLTQMVSRFVALAARNGLYPTSRLNGLDAYQLVIASSIVEKEGYYQVNMPKVARVIYNRLAIGMPLQMDSTILYALGRDGGKVTASDLAVSSPYNTYLTHGLPPTPTCVPSALAIRAVSNAPAGPWLYFVLINKAGVEAFSTTYAQQVANEAIARAAGV